jgi:hypothetical protein
MKKLSAGICMLVVLLPVFITCTFFVHQSMLRQQAEEQLERGNLTIISIAEKDLRWHKTGKELWIENKLFDVKSINKSKSGYCIVAGLFDDAEQRLIKQLDHLVGEDDKAFAFSNEIQRLMSDWFADSQTEYAFNQWYTVLPGLFERSLCLHSQYISAILTPPPQHAPCTFS